MQGQIINEKKKKKKRTKHARTKLLATHPIVKIALTSLIPD